MLSNGFYCPRKTIGRQKAGQIPGPCQRAEKVVRHDDDNDKNCSWSSWNNPKEPGKGTVLTGDQRKNWDHPDHSTVEIGQDTQKSSGGQRRLAVA